MIGRKHTIFEKSETVEIKLTNKNSQTSLATVNLLSFCFVAAWGWFPQVDSPWLVAVLWNLHNCEISK